MISQMLIHAQHSTHHVFNSVDEVLLALCGGLFAAGLYWRFRR